MRHVLASLTSLALGLTLTTIAACGDGEESFDNLPDCVADHASLGEPEAIAHCLLDFFDMNFADQAACEAYVTANGGYPNSRTMACTLYFQMHQ